MLQVTREGVTLSGGDSGNGPILSSMFTMSMWLLDYCKENVNFLGNVNSMDFKIIQKAANTFGWHSSARVRVFVV